MLDNPITEIINTASNLKAVNLIEADNRADELLNPPPVLAKEGYHGILREVARIATAHSEASPVAIAANFIGTFSAMIGRASYQYIGDGLCHPRPFFLITGRTGKARKGTAEFTVRKIFDAVEVKLGFVTLARHEGGAGSGEGRGYAVRDIEEGNTGGTDDKRLLLIEAEFAGLMANASRDKSTLSATIRTAWDGKTISPLVKNSMWAATDPHICLIGHITAPELIGKMSDVDALSGFLNRFIILHVARARLVPLPKPTSPEDIDRVASIIAELVCFATNGDVTAKNTKRIDLSHAAMKFWCEEYPALTAEQDGIAGALLVRTEIYARMLAMVFALMDKSSLIEVVHIKAALAWVNYWKASVTYIFQTLSAKAESERLNENAADVLEFIRKNSGCSRSAITTAFKHSKLSSIQMTGILNHLMNSAPPLIRQQQLARADGKPGKGAIVFWIK